MYLSWNALKPPGQSRHSRHFPAMRSSCVPGALPVTTAGQRGGTDGTRWHREPGSPVEGIFNIDPMGMYLDPKKWRCCTICLAIFRGKKKHYIGQTYMVGTSMFVLVSEMAVDGQLKLRKDAQYADMIF